MKLRPLRLCPVHSRDKRQISLEWTGALRFAMPPLWRLILPLLPRL